MKSLPEWPPAAYPVFLGRFPKPTPVQLQAIPLIMEGKDVLICAPTASGKTEAFAAPAAEMVRFARSSDPRVLILSPTRALANDLYRRLQSRFEDSSVSLGRYTGEHKDRVGGKLPAVAIATPEALDSLLARRSAALRSVRLLVMDEIHILDGSTRGDHLRVLLHRLRQATGHHIQRLAVSATVDHPEALARRYLHDASIVTVPGNRPLLVRSFPGSGPEDVVRHCDTLAEHGLRKILIFCNRRADVETLTRKLREQGRFREAIFPHHGSLSQTIRERTEERFLSAPAAVAIATMTLEIGIDIGSVDYVLLVGLPLSVASLLQRIGRGNRRTGQTRAGYTVDRPRDEIIASKLFRSAKAGQLHGAPYAFRPSVIVQQALVLAGAHHWVDAARLEAAVPPELWQESAPAEAQDILETLVERGHLEASGGRRYVLSESIEARYERGVLHSNLADDPGVEVIDRLTGEVIGKVDLPENREQHLAGESRRIVAVTKEAILTDRSRGDVIPQFSSKGIPLTSFALARAVVRSIPVSAVFTDLREFDIPHFRVGSSLFVLHGLGTLGGWLLSKWLEKREDLMPESQTAYGLRVATPNFRLPAPALDELEDLITREARRLEELCAPGPWHGDLPRAVKIASLTRLSGAAALADFLAKARLVPVELGDEDRQAWADLVASSAPLRPPQESP